MKIFHCDHCGNLVFFENVQCLVCQHPLAYLPDLGVVGSLEKVEADLWRSPIPRAQGKTYRLCQNYSVQNVCNWAVARDDDNPLCLSCRLTRVIPDLSRAGNKEAWFRIETAKRRLIYTLLSLGIPVQNKIVDPEHGLVFEFLADPDNPALPRVLTGHDQGVITINIAEADDALRERHRLQMHEPYRTLLGHFRHEVGHYYWELLIRASDRLTAYRNCFGDEREGYGDALARYYREGAPVDWPKRFVSAYASSHSWEDWAESWAHYLHMIDTLETADCCGLSIQPPRKDEPAMPATARAKSFKQMLDRWFSVTYVLNNLNRGLGLNDAYPFVLSTPAIEKLEFVHETVHKVKKSGLESKG